MARYTESPTEPGTPSAGDRWYDTDAYVEYRYDGTR